MAITQVSLFIENKQGKLAEAVKILSEAGINIRAMSVADTQEFGILRMIVSDTKRTMDLLSESYIVKTNSVIAAKMEDRPGALSTVLDALSDAQINVDYMYAFTGNEKLAAYVIIRVDDVEKAENEIAKKGIALLDNSIMASL